MSDSQAWTTADADYYAEHKHCGRCGQPGAFCFCTERDPCGCRHLHTMGSGRLPGALDAFSDTPAAPVIEQDDLFGGDT